MATEMVDEGEGKLSVDQDRDIEHSPGTGPTGAS